MSVIAKSKNMFSNLLSRHSSYFTALMILKQLMYSMNSGYQFSVLDVFLKSLKTELTTKLKID